MLYQASYSRFIDSVVKMILLRTPCMRQIILNKHTFTHTRRSRNDEKAHIFEFLKRPPFRLFWCARVWRRCCKVVAAKWRLWHPFCCQWNVEKGLNENHVSQSFCSIFSKNKRHFFKNRLDNRRIFSEVVYFGY